MADLASAVGGNFAAFGATLMLLGIYVGTIIFAIIFKSKFIIRVSELIIGLMFALILFMFGGGVGKVMGIVIIALGFAGLADYFHIFKKKLQLPLVNRIDPNICNFTCFIMIVLILLMFVPETAVGVIIGLIVLIIVVVLLAIFGGEVVAGAAAEAGGAAEELGGATRLAPEALGEEGEMQQMLKTMAKEGGGRMPGAPGAAAEQSAVAQVDQAKTAAFKASEEQVQAKRTGLEGELTSLEKEMEAASKIGDKKLESSLQKQIKDVLGNMEKLKMPKAPEESKGGFGRIGRFGSEGTSSIGHNAKLVIIVLALILGVMIFLAFLSPNSAAGQSAQGIIGGLNAVTRGLTDFVVNGIQNLMAYIVGQFTTCEVGNTGVACQLLNYRSCEPFCTSQTGQAPWHGFEITQLDVVPQTIFDYQKFSILAEFTNNGDGDVQFTGVSSPTFGYFVSGHPLCQWDIYGLLTYDLGCKKIFPIKPDQPPIQTLSSGKCALPGGQLASPCNLSPLDSTQVRWLGFAPEADVVQKGTTVSPDIVISIPYTFVVPNDLVGTIAVQTIGEQATAATGLKKEGQIVQKINKAYSPPGPLMMAMGTAEKQVVSGIPSLFIIQFANKGNGVVDYGDGTGIYKDDIRVYTPPDFVPYYASLCDFDLTKPAKKVYQLDKATKTGVDKKTEYERWNPGPGFENYTVYEITYDIPAIGQTRSALETPTLYCVLTTPNVTNIQTYDFKTRVLKYGYTESKRTSISITGTSIGGLGGGQPAGVTKEFTMPSCQTGEFPLRLCNSKQTLELDKEYSVTQIRAEARHGGAFPCDTATIQFSAYSASGQKVDFGTASNVPLHDPPGRVTKSYSSSIKVKTIEAAIVDGACKYVDTFSASVTYLPTNDLSVSIAIGDGGAKGTVTSSPAGIDCGATCKAGFNSGTKVTLTATPDSKSKFDSWHGACTGTTPTCTVTMDAAKEAIANFAPSK